MNDLQGLAFGVICQKLILNHLDCCVMDWFELARVPADLSDPCVFDTIALWRYQIDLCLMREGVPELVNTFDCGGEIARFMLLNWLCTLRVTYTGKGVVQAVYDFDPRIDPLVVLPAGRDLLGPLEQHPNDWRKVINGN